MKTILILGAGRSSTLLIDYLLDLAEDRDWLVVVADRELSLAEARVKDHPKGMGMVFDVNSNADREQMISQAAIVVSMLPADMHLSVAKDCVRLGKPMVTASYETSEMRALDAEAKAKGVLIMNEVGLDPGIDHMSAMRVIDRIKGKKGRIIGFESFTGGLVAPESDDNPWNYKFTWNPRNVVLAGSGGAVKFIDNGKYKYIPYHRVFRRTEVIDIPGYGSFEGYANRDSLAYQSLYELDGVQTMYRGTLRRPGFCRAWDLFVQLGLTDDSYIIEDSRGMTHREFINSFLKFNPNDSVELKLMQYLKLDQDDTDLIHKLRWLDLFEDIPIGIRNATPAQILQHILERKWELKEEDRDMIVMWHKFTYRMSGATKELHASMVVKGSDPIRTAMAKTVGLPAAVVTRLIMENKIKLTGVHLPLSERVYRPVLKELENSGISFEERQIR